MKNWTFAQKCKIKKFNSLETRVTNFQKYFPLKPKQNLLKSTQFLHNSPKNNYVYYTYYLQLGTYYIIIIRYILLSKLHISQYGYVIVFLTFISQYIYATCICKRNNIYLFIEHQQIQVVSYFKSNCGFYLSILVNT